MQKSTSVPFGSTHDTSEKTKKSKNSMSGSVIVIVGVSSVTEQNIPSERTLPLWTGKSAAKTKKMEIVNLLYNYMKAHCELQFSNPLEIGYY